MSIWITYRYVSEYDFVEVEFFKAFLSEEDAIQFCSRGADYGMFGIYYKKVEVSE